MVGAGGVGSAFVAIASRRDAVEHITVADIDPRRAAFAASTASRSGRKARVDGHHGRRPLGVRRRRAGPDVPCRDRPQRL